MHKQNRKSLKQVAVVIIISLAASYSFATHAALISGNDTTWGIDSITTDTSTGLVWLDVNNSLGISYNDMQPMLAIGGTYYGWRYAFAAEVDTLFLNGGIPYIGTHVDNLVPGQALSALLGSTSTQGGYLQTLGITGTFAGGGVAVGFLNFLYVNGIPTMSAQSNLLVYGVTFGPPTVGSWLVRPVPLPGAAWLALSALIALFGVGRKSMGSSLRITHN